MDPWIQPYPGKEEASFILLLHSCEQNLELLPPFPAVGGEDRQWENKELTLDLSYSLLVSKHTLDYITSQPLTFSS